MAAQKTVPWSIEEVNTFLSLVGGERIQLGLDGATRDESLSRGLSSDGHLQLPNAVVVPGV